MYEKCTYQAVPDPVTADRATLKQSLLHHFIQDLEYHHTSTLSVQQQMEVSIQMLFDPSLQEKFKDMQASVTYNEQDMMDYKNFVREQMQNQHPLLSATTSKTTNKITPQSIRSLSEEIPMMSEELKELLKKLEN